jgi:adenylate cyclase
MTTEDFKRKLSAILSADVKGYSRLMGEDEEATIRTLKGYRELIAERTEKHRGRVVDSPGDNVLAEFGSVVDAVRCAVEIQEELKVRNTELPENRQMKFRIGVNLGDVIEDEKRLYGDGVNIAARVEGLAEGGGICISGSTYEQVRNKLTLGYEYLGEHTVKNIEQPVKVYRVLMEPEAAGKVIGEERPTPRRWRRAVIAAVVVVILVAGALAIWNFYFRLPPMEVASVEKMTFPLPDKPSIAVLPFDNMSGDPDQDYFSDGLTDQIITGLSKIPKIFVIARNSTFTYKDRPVKIQKVAEDLGVKYVVEGSVQKSTDRIRITAQLIDATTGHHLWSERYDRDLEDIFAVQDDITMQIMKAVGLELGGDEERAWQKHMTTTNLEAYEKLLKAYPYFQKATKGDNAQARQIYEEAIALDSQFAAAYVMVGYTHFFDGRFGWTKSRVNSFKMAFKCAQKALDIDDTMDYAHTLLAAVYLVKRQYAKAVTAAEHALALNPNGAHHHSIMAGVLGCSGRWEESIDYGKKSLRLDPFPVASYFHLLGRSYFMTGQYDEAILTFKKALGVSPNYLPGHAFLAASYISSGRESEAAAAAEEVLRINPKFCIESYAKTLPYKNKSDIDRYLLALRKAGLPEKPPLPLPDKPSIAVLPFVNMSEDPKQEYFSDGITEEIITALSKTPKLFIIARNSTFTYKGKPTKVQQVGRELGVKYVLEGSVRKAGDRIRITAQLVDAQTGNHLWAERYDRDLKDIFAIQDEITLEIIKAMQVELTMGETASVTGKGTKNLYAYLKALQAQEQWLRMDKEGSIKARQLATEAIAVDPEYGYPHAIVAWCYMLDVVRHYTRSPKESMNLAVEAIQRGLALDISDHRIHRVLSNLYVMQGKHDEAISSSKRALELCPGGAGPYENLGIALLFACRPIEAIPMLEKAIELDPFPPAVCHRNLSMAYLHVGRYEDAIVEGKKAFQINPNDLSTPLGLVFAYAKLGRKEEARAAAAEVLRINPEFTLDSLAETRARMFATKCHSDRVYEDIEFIRKADVGLK